MTRLDISHFLFRKSLLEANAAMVGSSSGSEFKHRMGAQEPNQFGPRTYTTPQEGKACSPVPPSTEAWARQAIFRPHTPPG